MIIKNKISKEELQLPFTKAVVDIERKVFSIGCELHSDCAEELTGDGSKYSSLWGANIYPDGHLDFISLINVRPQDNNRSMEIQSEEIRNKITKIVKKFL